MVACVVACVAAAAAMQLAAAVASRFLSSALRFAHAAGHCLLRATVLLSRARSLRRACRHPLVAPQALCDLEANSNDLKAELRELYIVSAKEVDVTGRKV